MLKFYYIRNNNIFTIFQFYRNILFKNNPCIKIIKPHVISNLLRLYYIILYFLINLMKLFHTVIFFILFSAHLKLHIILDNCFLFFHYIIFLQLLRFAYYTRCYKEIFLTKNFNFIRFFSNKHFIYANILIIMNKSLYISPIYSKL